MQKKVYRGIPFSYSIKKDGYWDRFGSMTCNKDTSLDIKLEPYPNLGYQILLTQENIPQITFLKQLLPNRELLTEQSNYCIAPHGHYYLTYSPDPWQVVGMLTHKGTAYSGFSHKNYLKLYLPYITPPKFKFVMKIHYTNINVENYIMSSDSYEKYTFYISQNHTYCINCSNFSETGKTILEENKDYWLGFIADGKNIKGYLLPDNGSYTQETLPPFTQDWTEEFSYASKIILPETWIIGMSNIYESYDLHFPFDTQNLYIWYNDEIQYYQNKTTGRKYICKGILEDGCIDDGNSPTFYVHYQPYSLMIENHPLTLSSEKSIPDWYRCGLVDVLAHTQITPCAVNICSCGLPVIYKNYTSRISDKNYLYYDLSLPQTPQTISFTCHFKFEQDTQIQIGLSLNGNHLFYITDYSSLSFYTKSTNNTFSLEKNAMYWVRGTDTPEQGYALYVLRDNGNYTLATLPPLESWHKIGQSPSHVLTSGRLHIGINSETLDTYQAWKSKIDLENMNIQIGNTEIWRPLPA